MLPGLFGRILTTWFIGLFYGRKKYSTGNQEIQDTSLIAIVDPSGGRMRVTGSSDEEESSRPPRSFDRNDNGRTSLDPTPMECSNLRNPSNLIIFVTNHFFTSKSLSFLPVSRVITRSLLELNRKLDRRGRKKKVSSRILNIRVLEEVANGTGRSRR